MKLEYPKEWFQRSAEIEGESEVGAGVPPGPRGSGDTELSSVGLSFSHKKAIQSLNFFAVRAGGSLNKMKALKLIYFADRCHLRTHGRPITNDTYFAMAYGPVASACLNLLNEDEDFTGAVENSYRAENIERLDKNTYRSVAPVNVRVLSESDLAALQFSWDHYAARSQFQLAEETHLFPEWLIHKAALDSGQATRRHMPYRDFLENPPVGVDPLPLLDPEIQQVRASGLEELHSLASIWR